MTKERYKLIIEDSEGNQVSLRFDDKKPVSYEAALHLSRFILNMTNASGAGVMRLRYDED